MRIEHVHGLSRATRGIAPAEAAPPPTSRAANLQADRFEPVAGSVASMRGLRAVATDGGRTPRPVVYQLVVRTFGNTKGVNRTDGTLASNGVGKFSDINDAALASLKDLGVTHVWLTGVLRQATATAYPELGLEADDPDILKGRAGSFYAIRDYYDVSPDYADDPARRREEFRALVDRIHAHGMKVLVDFVPNHVARSYHSVVHPERDFGLHDDKSVFFRPQNNFFYLQDRPGEPLVLRRPTHWTPPGPSDERFEPEDGRPGHVPRMTGNRAAYEVDSDDWKEVVKLNYGYDPSTGRGVYHPIPDTWKKMDAILAYWQNEMGVDGFRVDYAHVVPVAFWRWAIPRARERDPDVVFTAEAYESAPDKIPGFRLEQLLDAGFDSVYDDELYDGLREVIRGPKWANDIDGWLEKHAGNEQGLLHYVENHDEVRVAADPSRGGFGDPRAGLAMAAVAYLATRGPNLVFNGQEVGERAEGVEGFGGDDGRTTIFDYWSMPAMARWVGADHRYAGARSTPAERKLREAYRSLLHLSQRPPFSNGLRYNLQWYNAGRPDYDSGEHVYAFLRHDGEGHRALVVVNLSGDGDREPVVRLPKDALEKMGIPQDAVLRLASLYGPPPKASAARAAALAEQGLKVPLGPFGVSVISLDDGGATSA